MNIPTMSSNCMVNTSKKNIRSRIIIRLLLSSRKSNQIVKKRKTIKMIHYLSMRKKKSVRVKNRSIRMNRVKIIK